MFALCGLLCCSLWLHSVGAVLCVLRPFDCVSCVVVFVKELKAFTLTHFVTSCLLVHTSFAPPSLVITNLLSISYHSPLSLPSLPSLFDPSPSSFSLPFRSFFFFFLPSLSIFLLLLSPFPFDLSPLPPSSKRQSKPPLAMLSRLPKSFDSSQRSNPDNFDKDSQMLASDREISAIVFISRVVVA